MGMGTLRETTDSHPEVAVILLHNQGYGHSKWSTFWHVINFTFFNPIQYPNYTPG